MMACDVSPVAMFLVLGLLVLGINPIVSRKMKVIWDNFSASSSRDSESRVCRGDFSKDFA